MRQVLLNLLGNGIKFTREGKVLVRARSACARSKPGDPDSIRCMVSDTGIGIPHDKQSLLFKEFSQADASTTRQFGGTGLGLAISRRLIELMGGMLDFSSEPGGGFSVLVHVADPQARRERRRHGRGRDDAVALRSRSGRCGLPARILVAEDNAVNQRLVKRMLEKMGHLVDIAADGYQAVTLAMANPYDIVIMDCSMPEMDGYQATAEIRRLNKEGALRRIPVIALTANALPEDRERCLAAGMDDYLSKPIARDDLHAMLEKYLGAAAPAGEARSRRQPLSVRALDHAAIDAQRRAGGGR